MILMGSDQKREPITKQSKWAEFPIEQIGSAVTERVLGEPIDTAFLLSDRFGGYSASKLIRIPYRAIGFVAPIAQIESLGSNLSAG